jgi:hypothetical protein
MATSEASTTRSFTDAELSSFGIQPADEYIHPWSPDHTWWNESWFWDWFSPDGSSAGHLRLGVHPNQDRVWLWYLHYDGENWIILEETRLPMSDWDLEALRYDQWGLSFSWEVAQPLRGGRLKLDGYGRVVSGPKAGYQLPVGCDLEISIEGVPHSTGQGDVEGHMDDHYSTARFEQPISVHGTQRVGPDVTPFDGQGERDHSWGPRDWNMEWIFCVVGGADLRMQWAAVDIPGADRIAAGYLLRDGQTVDITDVKESLDLSGPPTNSANGQFTLTTANGETIEGQMTTISGAEIDIAHCFDPPRPAIYRRSLVEITLAGDTRIGWLEFNRFDPARSAG